MAKRVALPSTLALFNIMAGCYSTYSQNSESVGRSEMLYRFQWNVTEIMGKPILTPSTNQPFLLFFPGTINQVTGNTGCNRLNGSFDLTGTKMIKFSPKSGAKKRIG